MFRFYSLSSESNFTLTCPGIAIDRQEYSFKMANILNMCFIEKYPMFRGMTETEIFFFLMASLLLFVGKVRLMSNRERIFRGAGVGAGRGRTADT